jgi:murein DD-endopeptidase MepM/ murein hydrolase activator NlpD
VPLAALLAAVLAAAPPAPATPAERAAPAAGSAAAKVEALAARRRAEEAAARMLAAQERSVLGTLGEIEAGLAAADAAARQAEVGRAAAEGALAAARAEEAAAQARLQVSLAELRPRLAARGRLGRAGALPALLASTSLADLVKRRYLLDRILARDVAVTAAATAALEARERARAAQQVEAARLADQARAAAEAREDAAARREERAPLHAALRTARGLHERAAAEAGVQAARLAELVATLPSPRRAAAGFAGLRGHLPLPVRGTITVGFGRVVDARFGTETVQSGLDIRAPAGATVRAVAPGRVAHAGWFKGYGNIVILDHGGGYHTLVAHLASMRAAVGEEVDAGAELGSVGDSGSLKGPYLYFELREHGRPVDPSPWLAR